MRRRGTLSSSSLFRQKRATVHACPFSSPLSLLSSLFLSLTSRYASLNATKRAALPTGLSLGTPSSAKSAGTRAQSPRETDSRSPAAAGGSRSTPVAAASARATGSRPRSSLRACCKRRMSSVRSIQPRGPTREGGGGGGDGGISHPFLTWSFLSSTSSSSSPLSPFSIAAASLSLLPRPGACGRLLQLLLVLACTLATGPRALLSLPL